MNALADRIRDIPDFPIPGILFRDVTPLLRHPGGLTEVVDALESAVASVQVDAVVGIESRGFLFGAPLAMRLGVGFVPIRKPGKLPSETRRREYALEYGSNAVEIHADALAPGDRVLVVDDLLATGGTAAAAVHLVRELGADPVAAVFVVELEALAGREALAGVPVFSLIRYP